MKTEDGDDKENECSLNVVDNNLSMSDTNSTFKTAMNEPPSTPLANITRRSVCDPAFATPSFPSQFKKKRFYKQ